MRRPGYEQSRFVRVYHRGLVLGNVAFEQRLGQKRLYVPLYVPAQGSRAKLRRICLDYHLGQRRVIGSAEIRAACYSCQFPFFRRGEQDLYI